MALAHRRVLVPAARVLVAPAGLSPLPPAVRVPVAGPSPPPSPNAPLPAGRLGSGQTALVPVLRVGPFPQRLAHLRLRLSFLSKQKPPPHSLPLAVPHPES